MSVRVKKISAGNYTVTDGEREVTVIQVTYPNDGTYWIAASGWDHNRLSDPLDTKREAVRIAKRMLETAI